MHIPRRENTKATAAETASLSAAASSASAAESGCAGVDSVLVHILSPPPPPYFYIISIYSTQGRFGRVLCPRGIKHAGFGLIAATGVCGFKRSVAQPPGYMLDARRFVGVDGLQVAATCNRGWGS